MRDVIRNRYHREKSSFGSSPYNHQADDDFPRMTEHAVQRSAQRNISREAILAALYYGTKIHRTGRIFFTLRKKDVVKMPELHSFAGTTILVGKDGTVVTAYANENSFSDIKKKSKRRRTR